MIYYVNTFKMVKKGNFVHRYIMCVYYFRGKLYIVISCVFSIVTHPLRQPRFFVFFFEGQNPQISMGPSTDHPFPYPPPSDHNLALAQASFATRELGVKALDSSFSKHRYPRCNMGMAPSSLAPATYNRRLG
jgi:hypothetical protein